jgi:hypothetical protein
MDDSAYKALLDSYEATRLSLDCWLEFWTWLVIVGVACELVFIIWNHIEEHREWGKAIRRAMVFAPSKPGRTKLFVELFSVALVVGGISGEWRIEAMLGRLETNIRDANERRVLLLQQQAGEAKKSAKDAADAAKTAQDSAKKADDDAGAAQRKAVLAGKEADRLGNEIAMVQYFSSSRAVHDQKSLKTQLEPFRGQPAIFRSYKNDGDGYIMCGELVFVAQSAGMVTTNQCGEWPFPDGTTLTDGTVWPVTGLSVSGPTDDSMLALEQILSRVSPGLGATAGPFGKDAKRPSVFIVFVGKKSDVFVGDTAQTRDAERRVAAMKKAQKKKAIKP